MASYHKGEGDVVTASEHTPQQVSYHDVILILTPTVVCVMVDILLAEPMYFEEVMKHAHHCIGMAPLPMSTASSMR